jgi:hypothetical protein
MCEGDVADSPTARNDRRECSGGSPKFFALFATHFANKTVFCAPKIRIARGFACLFHFYLCYVEQEREF